MAIQVKLKELDQSLSGDISSGKIKLIAVSKYATDDQVKEAYAAGLRDFGENYVQKALERQQRLEPFLIGKEKIRWHLLGPLQSNKVNKAVGFFEYIQSVHSFELAEQINLRAQKLNLTQKILLQVNFTGDKNGFMQDQLLLQYPSLLALKHTQVCGLMTMGRFGDPRATETIFLSMRQLKEVLLALQANDKFELSMGMSEDYQIAAKFGATMIRIGKSLFN